ncbi:FAD-dependent oxidoreductase [Rhizobium leguminosarum]|uniref:FAD-dependent oxidoreductase n=1 Tax=Rhizobium leguminosarum TaxID=384 RepID=UPI001C91794E|nr:FAD-dependent oxidoreductase [Rhizobium leguminosarum]MBY2924066.1 FAD-dependent oxidoreductase [Rhizobium leguminosarum]
MARVAVIGAGVIGVSSAYLLARAGHDVTLIDAASEPGMGASAGNAAQLSWAYGDAMASPALLKHLPAIAMGRDPAFRIHWQLDRDFLCWGLKFLANTPFRRWWNNTEEILRLAEQSRHDLAILLKETDIEFDYRVAGKLHLYADRQSFSAADSSVARKNALGFEQRLLTRVEAENIEPALAAYQGEIAGAVYTPGDALGDAAGFCRQLTAWMIERRQVSVLFGRRVSSFVQAGGVLTGLRFEDRDELHVDAAIVAAGPQIRSLISDLPEARDIRPIRGYSLTVPRTGLAPSISLTDVKRKLAFAAIGDRFRAAGLADIERSGAGFDAGRFETLRLAASVVLPDLFERSDELMSWSGERPMTPTSKPIIAASRHIKGLYINAGHGMLGWTLALGSARRVVDLLFQ